MSQDDGGQVWNDITAVTGIGGWGTASPSPAKADGAVESDAHPEEKQRADSAVAASEKHPNQQSRAKLPFQERVRASYGDFIRRNGRSPQTYQQADRQLILRFVLAAERSGQKLNRGRIETLVKGLSPAAGRLNPSERDMYVRSLVTRIAQDPQRERVRLNKDFVVSIMPRERQQKRDSGTPAEHTTAVMAAYPPEVAPVKPEPPAIANEKKTYKEISAKIKSEARRDNKTLDDKSKDIEIVKELKTRGHSDEQIQRVLSHSPQIRNMSGPDKAQNIKDICDKAQEKIQDQVSLEDREKLWHQTIQSHDRGR
ncbi:hypothetical protein IQ273_07705 [Nodosilinea sp. LEGE 07298]|uniref:hypothetical protein n=1 Tax=Nodosilinea sp. LEGE 07298 TaxID=2777970 RepID=UPI00188060EB|nr:hypothetical protein [Nodosilinea sp. LEGE 07298]MBE9109298.1 hypothetical protein [Nodosilinea sp. LEGE 07298]